MLVCVGRRKVFFQLLGCVCDFGRSGWKGERGERTSKAGSMHTLEDRCVIPNIYHSLERVHRHGLDPIPSQHHQPASLPINQSLRLPTRHPRIIILRILRLIPQHPPPNPPPHHQSNHPRQRSRHPPRPPKRQTNLRLVQKQQQLRYTRLHALRLTIIQVAVQVAEEALAAADFLFHRGGRCAGGDGELDLDGAGGGAGGVGLEGVAGEGGDGDGLGGGGGDGLVVAFEGEDEAAVGERCGLVGGMF